MKKYIYISILVTAIIISLFLNNKYNSKANNNILIIKDELSENIDSNKIAIFIEGESSDSFPSESNYDGHIECFNSSGVINNINGNVSWDGQKWVTSISNIKNGDIKCNIYFTESTSGYRVGQKVNLLAQSSDTSSTWLTDTNGYNKDTGKYSLTTTYVAGSVTFEKENLEWNVWKKDGDVLTLISATPTTVQLPLNYAKSYNNSIYLMNDICSKIYGGSLDGVTARSINMTDILEKVFEEVKQVTYNGSTVDLIDSEGKALSSIITTNTSQMKTFVNAMFNTEYGTNFTISEGANKYVPQTIFNACTNTTIDFSVSSSNSLRNSDSPLINAPITTGTRSNTRIKPAKRTFSITDWADIIDSKSLEMLESTTDYWIASRDYDFDDNTAGSSVYYNVKLWTNNTVVPKTIYKSNVTSGQTLSRAYLRPIIEIDLSKVQINPDGSLSAIE